jgi:hypothetical protein
MILDAFDVKVDIISRGRDRLKIPPTVAETCICTVLSLCLIEFHILCKLSAGETNVNHTTRQRN